MQKGGVAVTGCEATGKDNGYWDRAGEPWQMSGVRHGTVLISGPVALSHKSEEAQIMKRLTQLVLASAMVLALVSLAAAQEAPQVVARVGNFIEVAPDVFMHIIATGDWRWRFGENYDFESRVQDRVQSRATNSTAVMGQECDCMHFQAHFGVDMRYRKELEFHLRFRHWQIYDANIADDRSIATAPGGVDKFGRGTSAEGENMNLQQAQINYTFPGAPVSLRLGWRLWFLDQAGIVSDNSPRAGVWFIQDPWEAHASAVIQREATRLGLTNDNDFIFYTFGAAYNLKPHRLQLDLIYFRDRFTGAPTGTTAVDPSPPSTAASRGGLGFQGHKHDVVMIMPSWSGSFGPLASLLQLYLVTGTAESSDRAAVTGSNRNFDVWAVGLIAYAEARLGLVSPYVGLVYGSGDGDPTDTTLKGFNPFGPVRNSSAWSGTARFAHLDRVHGMAGRDTKTPAGADRAPNPNNVFGGGDEFGHTVGHPFMDRLGNREHPGIVTALSNPGVISPFVGLKVFPLKGHEINGTTCTG